MNESAAALSGCRAGCGGIVFVRTLRITFSHTAA